MTCRPNYTESTIFDSKANTLPYWSVHVIAGINVNKDPIEFAAEQLNEAYNMVCRIQKQPHVVGSDPTCRCKEAVDSLAQEDDHTLITLDENDPFESVLVDIIRMNRRKRADYAADADIFSNFRDTASMLGLSGFSERESALFNILQKIARLKSLRANGRMDNPNNESVVDTVLDLAVYSVIYLALTREAEK